MTNRMRMHAAPLFVVLAAALTGCRDAATSIPTSPSAQTLIAPSVPMPTSAAVQVAGTVSDAAWRRLTGARVEVVGGPESGLSTTTDARGSFSLAGAFDDTTRFRATKDGHVAGEWPLPQRCERCNPNWWIHFELESSTPHPDLAGEYTFTLTATSTCASLPLEVRTFTYGATVTPANTSAGPAASRYLANVHGATFLDGHDSFIIGIAGDYLAAEIGDFGHGGAGLVEEIAENTYVTLNGGLQTQATNASRIAGPLVGRIERCELPSAWGSRYSCDDGPVVTHAQCSSSHELVLMRR